MRVALYARVSTVDKEQDPEVQLHQLRRYCADQGWEIYDEYVDMAPATDFIKRKEWARLLKAASTRRFKAVVVWRLDRAFRSVLDATSAIEAFNAYGVGFKSHMEPAIDTTTPMGQFVLNIAAAFAQLERQNIAQRVTAGLELAKQRGTRSGRPIGRPRQNIPLELICKAVHESFKRYPKGNYAAAARTIKRETGITASAGLVQLRLQRSGLCKADLKNGWRLSADDHKKAN